MVTLKRNPNKTDKKEKRCACSFLFSISVSFYYNMVAAEYRPLERDDRQSNINAPQSTPSPQRFIQPTTIYVQDYEQQHATASPFSCVINLANTILGTGMLAMVKIRII
jgi:hypothetical protein